MSFTAPRKTNWMQNFWILFTSEQIIPSFIMVYRDFNNDQCYKMILVQITKNMLKLKNQWMKNWKHASIDEEWANRHAKVIFAKKIWFSPLLSRIVQVATQSMTCRWFYTSYFLGCRHCTKVLANEPRNEISAGHPFFPYKFFPLRSEYLGPISFPLSIYGDRIRKDEQFNSRSKKKLENNQKKLCIPCIFFHSSSDI